MDHRDEDNQCNSRQINWDVSKPTESLVQLVAVFVVCIQSLPCDGEVECSFWLAGFRQCCQCRQHEHIDLADSSAFAPISSSLAPWPFCLRSIVPSVLIVSLVLLKTRGFVSESVISPMLLSALRHVELQQLCSYVYIFLMAPNNHVTDYRFNLRSFAVWYCQAGCCEALCGFEVRSRKTSEPRVTHLDEKVILRWHVPLSRPLCSHKSCGNLEGASARSSPCHMAMLGP